MRAINLTSLAGLMLVSLQQNAGVIENNQIMPPPGPYQSIMGSAPPAFVPYGSQQAKTNPYQQNQMPQIFSQFPANAQAVHRPAISPPEWVLNRQQENKDRMEEMLKQSEKINRENEKRYVEYLKKADLQAEKRDSEYRKWVAENNRQLKKHWQTMIEQFSEKQKRDIQQAQNLPEWIKKRMLKQHEQQLAMMNMQPPAYNGFSRIPPTPPVQATPWNRGFPAMDRKQMNSGAPRQNSPQMNPGFNRPPFVQPPMQQRMQPPMQPPMQPGQKAFNRGYAAPPGFGVNPTQTPPPFKGQAYPNPYNRYLR